MSKTQINFIGTFDRIKNEDDLKPKPGININPPPKEGRCDCCGRHISELKPFGGPGDPLVGDFTGAFLVKGYRSIGSFDEEEEKDDLEEEKDDLEEEKAFEEAQRCYEADGFADPLDWMIDKYGKEKAITMEFDMARRHCGYVTDSWECRDCMVLDMDGYFEKLGQRNK
jgi:hypothetical protein